jgi:hypothetical protein
MTALYFRKAKADGRRAALHLNCNNNPLVTSLAVPSHFCCAFGNEIAVVTAVVFIRG